MLGEGLVAGLIAYASVVVVVGTANLLLDRSFVHSAAVMGALILEAAPLDAGVMGTTAPAVLAYNGVHLVGSIVVGVVGALMVRESERHAGFWYFALTVLVAAGVYAIVFLGALGAEVSGGVEWWLVVVGTGVWLLAMSVYFGWRHRGLLRELRERSEAGEEPV